MVCGECGQLSVRIHRQGDEEINILMEAEEKIRKPE
jgi:hypothetical protein